MMKTSHVVNRILLNEEWKIKKKIKVIFDKRKKMCLIKVYLFFIFIIKFCCYYSWCSIYLYIEKLFAIEDTLCKSSIDRTKELYCVYIECYFFFQFYYVWYIDKYIHEYYIHMCIWHFFIYINFIIFFTKKKKKFYCINSIIYLMQCLIKVFLYL